jgi:hypothetical protein
MKKVDEKALFILKKYDVLREGCTSKEDFEYAKQFGLMFDNISQTHDECIKLLFKEYNNISKKKAVNCFLASLSSSQYEYRGILPVYAILQTFPLHVYKGFEENPDICQVCGSLQKEKELDLNFINQCLYMVGGVISKNIYEFTFYLKQANYLNDVYPQEEDYNIFNEIIKIVKSASNDEKPNDISKKIAKIKHFKSTGEQRKVFLETLGYCSILETPEHKGFLSKFTSLEHAPRKTKSSDWSYPVDWWTGKFGINEDAYNFWFGDCNKLVLN